ncbi:hypothetical protein AMECASPLE_025590 [Ameca splendens]|uniref:Uncharacterized protein n=1 Tax=Ameca splendens TaxID=208324 RepID=A0ABV0YGV7_9TELE
MRGSNVIAENRIQTSTHTDSRGYVTELLRSLSQTVQMEGPPVYLCVCVCVCVAEKVVALLQRRDHPLIFPQLVAPFFPTQLQGNRARRTTPSSRDLPGVFLWPVITASPVTGCSQVVLFASSLVEGKQM